MSHNLTHERWDHSSWARSDGVVLLGGQYSGKTTEIVTPGNTETTPGFTLKYDTE